MKYIILILSIFITSCASIFDSGIDFINLSTSSGSSVKANITSKAGIQTVYLPTLITVPKSCTDITVEIVGDGMIQPSSFDIEYHTNPWAYASVVFGGVIGLAIDGLTGKACTYDSTAVIPVNMKSKSTP